MTSISIRNVFPSKAIFKLEDSISLIVQLSVGHETLKDCDLLISIDTYYLEKNLGRFFLPVEGDPNSEGVLRICFALDIPEKEKRKGRGYGIVCELLMDGKAVDKKVTAFDIQDPDNMIIRYGFLCDFSKGDWKDYEKSLDFLTSFHFTHVQFYDWVYRHHDYIPPSELYNDIMGKEIDLTLLQKLISDCRKRASLPIAYGAVYAAGESYLEEHREEGLYDYRGNPHNLIDKFFIMNIASDSPWVSHIIEQYRYAIKEIGFSGIHMDSYGYPKQAISYLGGKKKSVFLEDHFPAMINRCRAMLEADTEIKEAPVLIFNNVGNWPVEATAPAAQDGVYIEVWDPYDTYHHIKEIILEARRYGKPVILAAYLAPFRTDENHGGTRSLNAACILTAAIVSHGATHLLLGEAGAALTQGYYNDYSSLRGDELSQLKRYYDFMTRYVNILYDPDLKDISETHTDGENREYWFSGAPSSSDGRSGTLWTIVRQSHNRRIIHIINLLSQRDPFWNKGKEDLLPVEEYTLQIPLDGEITRVFYCSPDVNDGAAALIDWKEIEGMRGPAVSITLRDVPLWSTVVMDMQELLD